MRMMILISLLASLVTFDPLPKLAWQDDAKKSAKAQELMSKTRAALGSEKVKSLSIAGTYRQVTGDREMSGDLELEMLLPDKFYKSSVMSPMSGIEITRLEVVNGENAWTDMQNNAPVGGGNFVFRSVNSASGNAVDAQKAQQLFVRQEWTRLLLGLLGQAPPSVPLEYTYEGEAEAPDGVADVIGVKCQPIGFSAQLFLDQKTHRPLMLSYQGRKPRMTMMTRQISSAPDGKRKTPEEIEKELKEAREKAQAQAQQEPLVEIQLRYEDYQAVNGITLPHRISRTIDGTLTEEWQLTKFKVNPTIKPDKFEKK